MITFPHPGRPLDAALAGTQLHDWAAAGHVFEALDDVASQRPAHVAITALASGTPGAPRRDLSYAALVEGIARAANVFRSLGVQRDGVVAYLLPSLLETQFVLWGAETAGQAFPINPLLRAEDIAALAQAAGVSVLVAPGPTFPGGLWDKALQVRDLTPGIHTLVAVQRPGTPVGAAPAGPGVADFAAAWQAAPARLAFADRPQPHDIAAIYHTGGTTGSPKLVVQTHRNQIAASWGAAAAIAAQPGDTMANGLPMFHVAATMFAGLAMLLAGARVLLLSPSGFRDADLIANFWRIVQDERVTIVGGVPTALSAVAAQDARGTDLHRVRVNVCGAATTPQGLAHDVERITQRPLHEVYGMTECAGVISVDPAAGQRVIGSAGLPIPFCQVRARQLGADGRPGRTCAPGEAGVLVVQGPNVTPGYQQAAHNRDLFTDDGWLITGDLGTVDADGRIFIRGRAKDLIISGGHNIDPALIEESLAAHPDVTAVAAVGMPDLHAGEVPVAYVTLRPGAACSEDSLRAYAADHIAEPPALPRRVFVMHELPLTAVGKIHKPTLRNDATRRHLQDVLRDLPVASVTVEESAQHGRLARLALQACVDAPQQVRQAVTTALRGYAVTIAWEAPPVAL